MPRLTVHTMMLSLVAVTSPSALAQEVAALVELDTNADEAAVFVDGSYLGPASSHRFVVPPGSRELRLVAADGYGWSVPPLTQDLDRTSAGDTIRITLNFPYYYRFESTPGDAEVVLRSRSDGHVLGRTPTTVESSGPLAGTLEFRLDGFESEVLSPGVEIWNFHSVDLTPTSTGDEVVHLALTPPATRRKWIDYVAVGSALAAGALAVHFKFEADRRFDRYQETGDPDLRPDIKRYDIYSGVALGVMQAGIGIFAIRLALR